MSCLLLSILLSLSLSLSPDSSSPLKINGLLRWVFLCQSKALFTEHVPFDMFDKWPGFSWDEIWLEPPSFSPCLPSSSESSSFSWRQRNFIFCTSSLCCHERGSLFTVQRIPETHVMHCRSEENSRSGLRLFFFLLRETWKIDCNTAQNIRLGGWNMDLIEFFMLGDTEKKKSQETGDTLMQHPSSSSFLILENSSSLSLLHPDYSLILSYILSSYREHSSCSQLDESSYYSEWWLLSTSFMKLHLSFFIVTPVCLFCGSRSFPDCTSVCQQPQSYPVIEWLDRDKEDAGDADAFVYTLSRRNDDRQRKGKTFGHVDKDGFNSNEWEALERTFTLGRRLLNLPRLLSAQVIRWPSFNESAN